MKHRKTDILKLFAEGKTYPQIRKILNCSISNIVYHCSPGQKAKSKARNQKSAWRKALLHKINGFNQIRIAKNHIVISSNDRRFKQKIHKFNSKGRELMKSGESTKKQIMEKIGKEPKCYLTGRKINLQEPATYQFDHIVPRTKGGDNSIENFGLACKEANQAKRDLMLDNFLLLCKDILEYNGYEVKQNQSTPS